MMTVCALPFDARLNQLADASGRLQGRVGVIELLGIILASGWEALAAEVARLASVPGCGAILIRIDCPAQQFAPATLDALEAIERITQRKTKVFCHVDVAYGLAAAIAPRCHFAFAEPNSTIGHLAVMVEQCEASDPFADAIRGIFPDHVSREAIAALTADAADAADLQSSGMFTTLSDGFSDSLSLVNYFLDLEF
jgi:hypothetical protein